MAKEFNWSKAEALADVDALIEANDNTLRLANAIKRPKCFGCSIWAVAALCILWTIFVLATVVASGVFGGDAVAEPGYLESRGADELFTESCIHTGGLGTWSYVMDDSTKVLPPGSDTTPEPTPRPTDQTTPSPSPAPSSVPSRAPTTARPSVAPGSPTLDPTTPAPSTAPPTTTGPSAAPTASASISRAPSTASPTYATRAPTSQSARRLDAETRDAAAAEPPRRLDVAARDAPPLRLDDVSANATRRLNTERGYNRVCMHQSTVRKSHWNCEK